jgi:hypothetical protein
MFVYLHPALIALLVTAIEPKDKVAYRSHLAAVLLFYLKNKFLKFHIIRILVTSYYHSVLSCDCVTLSLQIHKSNMLLMTASVV